MHPMTIKNKHRCRNCKVLWNYLDIYTYEDINHLYFCGEWCK
jgi:hypothetical protein